MTTHWFRAYERQLAELVRDAGLGDSELLALRDHLHEVMQLRMLSDPAALERDERRVRQWIHAEWQRLGEQMPRNWHKLEGELRAVLNGRQVVAA